jgi:HSP20 family protein
MKLMPWKKKESAVVRGDEGPSSLGLFRTEMNRLMDRFFADPWSLFDDDALPSFSGWAPSFDVVDGEKDVIVRAEIPGVDPKDVDVTVSGNVLRISGEKKDSREEEGKHVRRSECSYGSFRRSVELPEGVDVDKVSAEHANGILTVKVGKSKAAAAKRIPISAR